MSTPTLRLTTHLAARLTAAAAATAGPTSAATAAAAAPASARSYIKVPVRNGNFNKALREVTRILMADNMAAAWKRGAVFTRPAIARVEAAKAGAARRERAEFKRSMKWVMARRARGF